MAEQANTQLDELAVNVKSIVTKSDSNEADIKSAKKELADTKAAFTETKSEFEKTKKELEETKSKLDKVISAQDMMIAERKSIHVGPPQLKSFENILEEELERKTVNLKTLRERGKNGGFDVEISKKAVGNMSSANLTGGYLIPAQTVPGITPVLREEVHLRNLLPVGNTNSNIIRHIRDMGGEGGPGMVDAGGTKPQIDRDLQIYDSPVRKIATYFRVPEEMIEDIPYLSSFLSQIGMEEVMVVEDAQILYGDGTGQNLTGLFTAATAFAAGTSVIGASSNQYDVLRAAKKQLRVAKIGGPLVGLISPVDWFEMKSIKDTTNNYVLLGGGNGIDLSMNIDGIQLIEHTAITAGDFIVFSPRAAQIFDRTGTSVRFYDQDQDNAIKNLITIVIEKRLALVIYRPTAIVDGTFAAGITDLTS